MDNYGNPIVLLDMDSVLVEHNFRHIEKLNEFFGTAYTPEDIVDFKYEGFEEEEREFIFEQWERPDLYDNDELSQAQLDVIDNLREFARVVVCTSPMAGHIASKYRFLLRYFDRHDIIMASAKYLVSGGDVLVDDAPHNIRDFSLYTDGHAIIYDKPWNQGIFGPRAYEFEDIGVLVTSALMELGYDIY